MTRTSLVATLLAMLLLASCASFNKSIPQSHRLLIQTASGEVPIPICTTFPVSDRVIITAAHCTTQPGQYLLFNESSNKLIPVTVFFTPYSELLVPMRGFTQFDWSVGVLSENIGDNVFFSLPDESTMIPRRVFLEGYKNGTDFRRESVDILGFEDSAFDLDYLVWLGQSGGPVYNSDYEVIAVISARGGNESYAAVISPVMRQFISEIILLNK